MYGLILSIRNFRIFWVLVIEWGVWFCVWGGGSSLFGVARRVWGFPRIFSFARFPRLYMARSGRGWVSGLRMFSIVGVGMSRFVGGYKEFLECAGFEVWVGLELRRWLGKVSRGFR